MKLTATVTAVSAKSGNRDGQRRVTLTIAEAESMDRRFSVASEELREDEELVLLVLTREQAANIYDDLIPLVNAKVDGFVAFGNLCDQLRPDPPVPFLVDDTADTQEFVREVGQ